MTINEMKSYVCKRCKNVVNFRVKYDMPRIHHASESDIELMPSANILCSSCRRKTEHLLTDDICALVCSSMMLMGIKVYSSTKGKPNYYDKDGFIYGDVKPAKFSIGNFVKESLILNKQRKDIEDEYIMFHNLFEIFLECGYTPYLYNAEEMLYIPLDHIDEFDDMISRYEYIDFTFDTNKDKAGKNAKEVNEYMSTLMNDSILQLTENIQHLFRENYKLVEKYKIRLDYTELIAKHIDTKYRGDFGNDDCNSQ